MITKVTATLAASSIFAAGIQAAEIKVNSPDGKVGIMVMDHGGLSYSVSLDGREVRMKNGLVSAL